MVRSSIYTSSTRTVALLKMSASSGEQTTRSVPKTSSTLLNLDMVRKVTSCVPVKVAVPGSEKIIETMSRVLTSASCTSQAPSMSHLWMLTCNLRFWRCSSFDRAAKVCFRSSPQAPSRSSSSSSRHCRPGRRQRSDGAAILAELVLDRSLNWSTRSICQIAG
jgi:hypothetical protein